MAPSRRVTRAAAVAQTTGAPAATLDDISAMLVLLLKAEAHRQGVGATGDAAEVQQQLQEALEVQCELGDEVAADDAGAAPEEERSEEGCAISQPGQLPVTASDLTGMKEQLMTELQDIKRQGAEGKHRYGRPANRGKWCGVCTSKWQHGDSWDRGRGSWGACFSCQVYLCSFECLNAHNVDGVGDTITAGHTIHPSAEE